MLDASKNIDTLGAVTLKGYSIKPVEQQPKMRISDYNPVVKPETTKKKKFGF